MGAPDAFPGRPWRLLLLPPQQQPPASCASPPKKEDPTSSSSSSSSSSNLSLNEVYSRFAASVMVNTAASGVAAAVASLLLLRNRGPRVFAVGLAMGAPLGWGLRNTDLYLQQPRAFSHLLPPTSDPLQLLQQLQQQLQQRLQQQLNSRSSSSLYSQIKNKIFPKE
ncbi:hypothetical protein ACSSS7_007654 [Eimeria intestinalis]